MGRPRGSTAASTGQLIYADGKAILTRMVTWRRDAGPEGVTIPAGPDLTPRRGPCLRWRARRSTRATGKRSSAGPQSR
jgi:hypothetical protein